MSLTTPTKAVPVTSGPQTTAQSTSTSLKAMVSAYGGREGDERTGSKPVCKFWKSDDGCKRGAACTYVHDNTEMKVAKVKSQEAEKPETGEKIAKDNADADKQAGGSGTSSVRDFENYGSSRKVSRKTLQRRRNCCLRQRRCSRHFAARRWCESRNSNPRWRPATGQLDSWTGATNGLREARPHELPHLVPVRVELASGSVTLFKVKDHNTLLSRDRMEVHPLVKLRYRLQWTAAGVRINHPEHGRIECTLRGGCPVLPEPQALALLDIINGK